MAQNEVRDENGRIIGHVPSTVEQKVIERIKRDREANVPRYSAAQVEERLQRLQEIRELEGMDETKLHELLRKMRDGEEV